MIENVCSCNLLMVFSYPGFNFSSVEKHENHVWGGVPNQWDTNLLGNAEPEINSRQFIISYHHSVELNWVLVSLKIPNEQSNVHFKY
jgi:hypothetical protein